MNPYLIIALILAWIASLTGVGYWQNNAGHTAERSAWQERENTELRDANAKILALEEGARKWEKLHAGLMTEASANYQKGIQDGKKRAEADRLAIRTGGLRLFDPAAFGLGSCGNLTAGIGPSPGGRDGAQAGELSRESAEFLFEIANDADAIVEQLTACQQVVRADRAPHDER